MDVSVSTENIYRQCYQFLSEFLRAGNLHPVLINGRIAAVQHKIKRIVLLLCLAVTTNIAVASKPMVDTWSASVFNKTNSGVVCAFSREPTKTALCNKSYWCHVNGGDGNWPALGIFPEDPQTSGNNLCYSEGRKSFFSYTGRSKQCLNRETAVNGRCPDVPKNYGANQCASVGNPVNVGVGNKFQAETDFQSNHWPEFSFQRFYNSGVFGRSSLRLRWRHSFSGSISARESSNIAAIFRPDGKTYYFTRVSGAWVPDADIRDRLERLVDAANVTTGWRLTTDDDVVETYNRNGRPVSFEYRNGFTLLLSYANSLLTSVESNAGEILTFTYDMNSRLRSLTAPGNRTWQYQYATIDLLGSVINPDGTTRTYHYNEQSLTSGASLGAALTGITDERGIRYASFGYDAQARAVMSTHAGGAQQVTIDYDPDPALNPEGTRIVTNSTGVKSVYTTSVQLGVHLVTGVTGPGCLTCGSGDTAYNYDPVNNNLLSKTEQGVTTAYGNHDGNGNPGYRIEAQGTPEERRIDYTYDTRFLGRVQTVTEPSVYAGGSKVTSYTYDDFGHRTNESVNGFTPDGVAVARSTSWQFNGPLNQLSLIDGSRTDSNDITVLRYYANDASEGANRARLKEIEDAAGTLIRTNIQYTGTGKIASESRPNGLTITYTYYPGNDRLESQVRMGVDGSQVARWTYLATGEVESVTVADGTEEAMPTVFKYDDARRLTRITDGLGNYIEYQLDTEGNREGENVYDSAGLLRKALTRIFDIYNRLDLGMSGAVSGNPLETVDPLYGPDGTLDQSIDGEGTVTDYSYDALKRLLGSTQDPAGVGARTQYSYDAADRITLVIDPDNGTTGYVYDDLGNLLSTNSPDTGLATYTYDAAGNVKTKKTATGTGEEIELVYSYDAFNRLTSVVTPDPVDNITYTYDICTNGTGRLCQVVNGVSTVDYSNDSFGNVTRHQGIVYTYDSANRVKTVTYTSGAKLAYRYDLAGQVSSVDLTVDGQTQSLASTVRYAPFGSIEALTYGNGKALSQQWDTAYRLTNQSIPGILSLDYPVYDGNGNLKQRDDSTLAAASVSNFTYDTLNRLDTADGPFGTGWDYDYDLNGNRTRMIEGGQTVLAYESGGNRLDAIGNEDVILSVTGNTLVKGDWRYSYNSHQRLVSANENGVDVAGFRYNGLGQRVLKTAAGSAGARYRYGISGALLEETEINSGSTVEYYYLNGSLLAMRKLTGTAVPAVNLESDTAIITGNISVSWQGIVNSTDYDWVGVYEVGAGKRRYRDWVYTDGSTSGFVSLPLQHSQLVAGKNYELRLYANDVFDLLAVSDSFVLQNNTPTVTLASSAAVLGGTINVDWNGLATPTGLDWIGVYEVGAGKRRYRDWVYTNGSGSGFQSLTLQHSQLVAGRTYELRLYADDKFDLLATSDPFVLQDVASTVTVTSQSAQLGGTINASWSGITSPTRLDWVGVYEVGAGKRRYRDWVYTNGSGSGTLSLTLQHPQLVVGKSYELRLYANDRFGLLAVSDPFVLEESPVNPDDGLYYVHNDHLGTPQVMTDEAGNQVWRAVYDPFGKAKVDGGSTVELNVRFPGQYFDQETGLHYNYYRYYDPGTGRYVTADPIGLLLDNPSPSMLLAERSGVIELPSDIPLGYINQPYTYVKNNPLRYIDDLGLHHKLNHPWNPTPATMSLGDYFSELNGNIWGEFTNQDGTCSLGPIMSQIGDACFPERCERHDACFADNECNATSWISNILGGTKSCNKCNSGFFE